VLAARPNGLDLNRFGFSVSKRVGNAVTRNRVKRRLREAARLSNVIPGWDILLIARAGAGDSDYRELERSMTNLLKRAKLLRPHRETPALVRSASTGGMDRVHEDSELPEAARGRAG
jgi:ribonuclease P protein component